MEKDPTFPEPSAATPPDEQHAMAETQALGASAEADAPLGTPDPWRDEWEALQERHLRLAAEFENFRKRTARDAQDRARSTQADLLLDLLEIADNFERALAVDHEDSSYARGVALIRDQLESLLARRGVERMQVTGEKFDPELHEALLSMSSEVPAGYVCRELRGGYLFHGRTLRPAQVAVSSGPDEGSNTESATDEQKGEVKE